MPTRAGTDQVQAHRRTHCGITEQGQRLTAPSSLTGKLERLRGDLSRLGSAVVAYSGGVDSTLLAFVAHQVLGDRMLACTAVSAAIGDEDVRYATALAQRLGLPHRLVPTTELQNGRYVRNAPNRCAVCKGVVFSRLFEIATQEGFCHLVYGANVDDKGDYRPGMRAAAVIGARAPLVEAGLTKGEIRALARRLELPNADRPANACLSSRIPYGERITVEKLTQIAQAERDVHALGYKEVRVRHHGDVARLEVPAGRLPELVDPAVRTGIVRAIRDAGFAYIAVDLEGYRPGSLNEAMAKAAHNIHTERPDLVSSTRVAPG